MTVSRTRWSLTGVVWAALILAPALCIAQTPAETGPKGGSNLTRQTQNEIDIALPSLAPLVERVMPAVVNISVELKEQATTQGEGKTGNESASPLGPSGTPFDQFLKRFFEQPFQFRNPAEKVMALGSGFIIDPAGYIVTNNHVVANADKVTVIFQDNSRHTAKVIGRDEKTDIALLKIDTNQKLPYVTWGNSDDAKVGDWVVAVGNPFGLGGSVTAGIISALGRDINEGPYDDFLQIDAPINRGNSGGPTFNLHGQVIGINTAIYSPSGGSVGIGFAVPSNIAKHIFVQLKEHGHVTWGWLGVAIQSVTPPIAKSLRTRPRPPDRCAGRFGHPGQPGRSGRSQAGRRDHRRRRSRYKIRARPPAPRRGHASRQQAPVDNPARRKSKDGRDLDRRDASERGFCRTRGCAARQRQSR